MKLLIELQEDTWIEQTLTLEVAINEGEGEGEGGGDRVEIKESDPEAETDSLFPFSFFTIKEFNNHFLSGYMLIVFFITND